MSSYFHCLAYNDSQAKIRVEDDAIYMELKDGEIDIVGLQYIRYKKIKKETPIVLCLV